MFIQDLAAAVAKVCEWIREASAEDVFPRPELIGVKGSCCQPKLQGITALRPQSKSSAFCLLVNWVIFQIQRRILSQRIRSVDKANIERATQRSLANMSKTSRLYTVHRIEKLKPRCSQYFIHLYNKYTWGRRLRDREPVPAEDENAGRIDQILKVYSNFFTRWGRRSIYQPCHPPHSMERQVPYSCTYPALHPPRQPRKLHQTRLLRLGCIFYPLFPTLKTTHIEVRETRTSMAIASVSLKL